MLSQATKEDAPLIDIHNEAVAESANLCLSARRLLLASLGAVALSFDEANDFVEKLIARGAIAESDTQALLKELRTRMTQKREAAIGATMARAKVTKAAQVLEESVGEILHRFNIPSKREIEALRQKIDLLNQKVEELSHK